MLANEHHPLRYRRFLPDYRPDYATGQWTNRNRGRDIKTLSLEAVFAAQTGRVTTDRSEAPPPDLQRVIDRLEQHLSDNMGTPATADLLSEEYQQEGGIQRSFATPLEAAFLKDYVEASVAAGEMPRNPEEADAAVWVSLTERTSRTITNRCFHRLDSCPRCITSRDDPTGVWMKQTGRSSSRT